MSLARIPLPSIALVLSSDHTALPSRPSIIKFEFDPLQTIHPTFSGSSGVLVCRHLFLFVGSGMWQRTRLESEWRSRWPKWCANRPRWQPTSRGRTLFLPCCQWFCEFVASHGIQFRCFICSSVNECRFRYWTARRRAGFSNCVRWEKAQHFTWNCVERLEEWYCHEGVCIHSCSLTGIFMESYDQSNFMALANTIRSLLLQLKLQGSSMNKSVQVTKVVINE